MACTVHSYISTEITVIIKDILVASHKSISEQWSGYRITDVVCAHVELKAISRVLQWPAHNASIQNENVQPWLLLQLLPQLLHTGQVGQIQLLHDDFPLHAIGVPYDHVLLEVLHISTNITIA